MDPLSDVLQLLKPTSYASGGYAMLGDRTVEWPAHDGIKCYAVITGHCWLTVTGVAQPMRFTAGDCFLLPPGPRFCITTDLSLPVVDFFAIRDEWLANATQTMDETEAGDGTYIAGGHFGLGGEPADMLLRLLPPVIPLQTEADRAAMRWALERMREELRDPQPGGALVMQQLATMLLVQALRLHLADTAREGVGWLFALADRQMATALTAMHEDPGHAWTLAELARRVGMSRTAFAERFKVMVGTAPVEYLTRWRMLLAGDRLRTSAEPVAAIAQTLGYASESAFSNAFRREMLCSPRRYRQAQQVAGGTGKRLQPPG